MIQLEYEVNVNMGAHFFCWCQKTVLTLVLQEKNWFKTINAIEFFTNPRCTTKFLANRYKNKILAKYDYKMKDL